MTTRVCGSCNISRVYKICMGCRDIYYCNSTCQSTDWTRHIFACHPSRPINTADHLALAVRDKRLPMDRQTLNDWGIEKAMTTVSSQAARDLFSVYIDLIEVGKIKPRRLHQWRVEGRLAREIKAYYESLPQTYRDSRKPYQLFLEHQYLLVEPEFIDTPMSADMSVDRMYRRLWVRMGNSSASPPEEIIDYVKSLSPSRFSAFQFYANCLEGCVPPMPSPLTPWYLEFGLGACRTPQDRTNLMCSYGDLTDVTSFEEFYEAFSTGKILHLFVTKNVLMQLDLTRLPALADILEGMPHTHKTVWDLERWLAQELHDSEPEPEGGLPRLTQGLPVTAGVDYGYENCERNPACEAGLSLLYRSFFALETADPLKLHEACVGGRLLEFFERDRNVNFGIYRELFKRLLRPTTSGSRLTM
ncbi:hypothetical protein BC629DRAFT_565298 [Irpex lacteus]|nr:hypothetical protein BC629DRAFT_565298 [Irpex lacteus]